MWTHPEKSIPSVFVGPPWTIFTRYSPSIHGWSNHKHWVSAQSQSESESGSLHLFSSLIHCVLKSWIVMLIIFILTHRGQLSSIICVKGYGLYLSHSRRQRSLNGLLHLPNVMLQAKQVLIRRFGKPLPLHIRHCLRHFDEALGLAFIARAVDPGMRLI